MLSNIGVKSEILGFRKNTFFSSSVSWAFGGAEDDLGMSCSKQKLLVCQLIREKLYSSMLAATLGNLLAAAVTWMLVLETAVLHERRHRSMLLESVVKPLTSFQRRAQAD